MKMTMLAFAALAAFALSAAEVELATGRAVAVHKARIEFEPGGAARLSSPSAEWNSGVKFLPPRGRRTFDLSAGRYFSLDVQNLSRTRQLRLTLHISAEGAGGDSGDHAGAMAKRNRSVNTGIGLNPGEKGTMRILLPHPAIYGAPAGARGVQTIDTANVTEIALKAQWPFEDEVEGLIEARLSNVRVEGKIDEERRVEPSAYIPFIDKYGQFIHAKWPYKVTSDKAFASDLKRENAALKPAPGSWDRFGGWKDGPKLKATGHFRTQKVNGRWWLITPEGHFFFSLGIDVVRTMTDAGDGRPHPEWYAGGVDEAHPRMAFTDWNLALKFGKRDFASDYYDLVLRRFDSWGINTLGNWSAGDLMRMGRKPYVVSVMNRARGVRMLPGNGCYDTKDPDFERSMKHAAAERFRNDPAIAKAAKDPMCIGFFIDNELRFPGDSSYYEPYFRTCSEIIRAHAPGKLYLGCRFIGFRQSADLWAAAARYCDVITVNSYANSVYNLPRGLFSKAPCERPLLLGEFHFGCIDRGMFSGGLCPVATQAERARSFTRLVQGALCNPLFVGCHWFQYRDQPLLGRGDGEAYEIGFVDVCDRPYPLLVRAARKVGEGMYGYRMRGRLVNDMEEEGGGK